LFKTKSNNKSKNKQKKQVMNLKKKEDKEVKIHKEIDLLLKPMEYLKLVQTNKEKMLRKQQEDAAFDDLIEVIATDINNGLTSGFRKSLFYLKDGDLVEVAVPHDSRNIIQQRVYDYYIEKGYIIDFIPKNADEPGFEYVISAFDIDDDIEKLKVEYNKKNKVVTKSYIGNYELKYLDKNHNRLYDHKNFF